MRTRFPLWIRATVAGLAMVALEGCAGVSGDPAANPVVTGAPAAVDDARPAVELRKGMKPDEVRQALGEPVRTQQVRVPEGKAEKWVYARGKKTEVKQVVAGTREVPYFDPILKEMRTIPEPVYADEATTITEELHLFWYNGELIEWKTEYRKDRAYTR